MEKRITNLIKERKDLKRLAREQKRLAKQLLKSRKALEFLTNAQKIYKGDKVDIKLDYERV